MAAELTSDYIFPDIDDLLFKAKLGHYITHTKGGYFLRKFDLKVQSCYISSVVYILICMFPELGPEEMTEKIKRVLKFKKFNLKILNNVVGGNTADITSIRISSVKELDNVFENGIVFLGLVTPPQESSAPFGTIFHYFLLKRDEEGNYSILSSYGSTFVAMRQYQTALDGPEELTQFIKNLAKKNKPETLEAETPEDETPEEEKYKTPEVKKEIELFMGKYFLNPMYKTIQRKGDDDMEETYPIVPPKTDLKWLKNEPNDIKTEIGSYQKGPTYVMLFPNMLDIFKAEIAALELNEAEKKLESLGIEYNDYLAIHTASQKASEDAMTNIIAIREKIEAAKIKISEEANAQMAATIEELTPVDTSSAEDTQSDQMTTPKKGSQKKLLPPSPILSARVKRLIQNTPKKTDRAAEEEEEEEKEVEQTPPELYKELNELGIASPADIDHFDISKEEQQKILGLSGGKRTRKKNRKKTKKNKNIKRKSRAHK